MNLIAAAPASAQPVAAPKDPTPRLQRTITRLQQQIVDLQKSRDYWQALAQPQAVAAAPTEPTDAQVALLDPWLRPAAARELLVKVLAAFPAPQAAPLTREPLTSMQYNLALSETNLRPSQYEAATRAIERAHGIKTNPTQVG